MASECATNGRLWRKGVSIWGIPNMHTGSVPSLASVGISLFWGSIAFNLLSGYGNVFLGIVGAAVVGALSLGLHLGVRR